MATWSSRGLRGSSLEDYINHTNITYRKSGLALVQKVPTPITPIEIDKKTKHITLAFFEQKSTVDYIGVVQGIPICFDAKECHTTTFPLQNIHVHQMAFMEDWQAQEGVAFFLIYFTSEDVFYYMTFEEALDFWNRSMEGGRKSFRIDELDKRFFFRVEQALFIPYLEKLQLDLSLRDNESL